MIHFYSLTTIVSLVFFLIYEQSGLSFLHHYSFKQPGLLRHRHNLPFRSVIHASSSNSLQSNSNKRRRDEYIPSSWRSIDGKDVFVGSIVEYISGKGSKRLAYVLKRQGAHLDVVSDLNKTFSIPINRVTCHISENFNFDDLILILKIIDDLKQDDVVRVWTSLEDMVS
jgi:hypothetical protein